MKEAPRREPGYIEGVGFDDILSDDYFVRQIMTADPVISYEVYPIPHRVDNPDAHFGTVDVPPQEQYAPHQQRPDPQHP